MNHNPDLTASELGNIWASFMSDPCFYYYKIISI